MKEIERKFLVDPEKWKLVEKSQPICIKQGYISKAENGVVRVRIKGEKAYLTIKSKNYGAERHEFEYEIPVEEANAMFSLFCEKFIEKNRYEIIFENKLWEVDEFINPKQNFILAEIELNSLDEKFKTPSWIGREVTDEKMYFNSNIV